jgi:hypothetical protein
MNYTLLVGCPRHHEGHDLIRLGLPVRADVALEKMRCRTIVDPKAPKDKPEERFCDLAIMWLGVEASPE